jgi:hypothetical protein
MPSFTRIVSMAYLRILGRAPDPGGLQNFNTLMNQGLTEAQMREALLRSPEYAAKNPDLAAARATGAAARGARRKARPRKRGKRR